MIFERVTLSDLDDVAQEFLRQTGKHKHFAFHGAMGAGKTTFIKALCKVLGVTETVTSPTFALVNEYNINQQKRVYHFDFYRINKPEEVFDFGCEEYFASGNYCFVEWPQKAEIILPEDTMNILVEETEDGFRRISSF